MNLLSQGWFSSLLGISGIIIGIIVAFYFYRKSKIGARPVYQVKTIRLIDKDKFQLPTDIALLFKGRSVERLNKTYFVLWNSGTQTVRGRDIVEADKLRLIFDKETEILVANIVKKTREVNKFKVELNNQTPCEVLCYFDFLDPSDGVVIELLHTSKLRHPEINGSIIGIPRGVLNWGIIRSLPVPFPIKPIYKRLFWGFYYAFGFLYILLGIWGEKFFPNAFKSKSDTETVLKLVIIVSGVLVILTAFFIQITRRKRFPKVLYMEDFD